MFFIRQRRGSMVRQSGTPAPVARKGPNSPGPFPDCLIPGSVMIEKVRSAGFSGGAENFQVTVRLPQTGSIAFRVVAAADECGGISDLPLDWPDREKWRAAILEKLMTCQFVPPLRPLVERQAVADREIAEMAARARENSALVGLDRLKTAQTRGHIEEILDHESRRLGRLARNCAALVGHVATAKGALKAIAARQAACVASRKAMVAARKMSAVAERDAELADLRRWAEFFETTAGAFEIRRVAALAKERAAIAEAAATLRGAPAQLDAHWQTISRVLAGPVADLVKAANAIKELDAVAESVRRRFLALGLDFGKTFPGMDLAPRFVASRSHGAHVGDFLAELQIPGIAPRGTVAPPDFIYRAPLAPSAASRKN